MSQLDYTINLEEMGVELLANARAGTVPLFLASPGVGKSDVVHQFAEENDLELIDVRLSSYLPEDINGFPTKSDDGETAKFIPFDTFPTKDTPLPEGKVGWLLFLDEFTSMSKSVQPPTYKLLLDRMVGNHKLHPNVIIAAAGNKDSDRAVTVSLSSAIRSRIIMYNVHVDTDIWLRWANRKKLNQRIRAYINYQPSDLHQFDPNVDLYSYRCPRSWAFLSKLIDEEDDLNKVMPRIAGTIGSGGAVKFKTFVEVYDDLPRISDILNDPEKAKVPDFGATCFATSLMVADHVGNSKKFTDTLLESVLKYMIRFEPEHTIVFLRTLVVHNKNVRSNPLFIKYTSRYINDF